MPHLHLRGAGTSDYACLLCFWIIWKGGPGRHNGSELHMNGNTVSCYKSESVCTCMLEVPIMWKGVLKVTLKIPLFLHYGECTDHCHLLYCMCAIFEVLHHGSLVSNTAYTLSPLTLGGHNNHCWISSHSEQISRRNVFNRCSLPIPAYSYQFVYFLYSQVAAAHVVSHSSNRRGFSCQELCCGCI